MCVQYSYHSTILCWRIFHLWVVYVLFSVAHGNFSTIIYRSYWVLLLERSMPLSYIWIEKLEWFSELWENTHQRQIGAVHFYSIIIYRNLSECQLLRAIWYVSLHLLAIIFLMTLNEIAFVSKISWFNFWYIQHVDLSSANVHYK